MEKQNKTVKLEVRLTSKQKKELKAKASLAGMSISKYVIAALKI